MAANTSADAIYKDENWLREQYLEKGQSLKKVASICFVTTNAITYWMKKVGIKTRNKKEAMKMAAESFKGELNPNWKGGKKTRAMRLAREAWRDYHGRSIPDGFDIHHHDRDRTNNDIENLQLIKHNTHARLHRLERKLRNHVNWNGAFIGCPAGMQGG